MIWLILQMLLCLVLAAALGGLLGWWLRGLGVEEARRRENDDWEHRLADYKQRLEECRSDGQRLSDRLAASEARSAELARRLAEALAAAEAGPAPDAAEPGPPGEPPASPERWLVTGETPPGTDPE